MLSDVRRVGRRRRASRPPVRCAIAKRVNFPLARSRFVGRRVDDLRIERPDLPVVVVSGSPPPGGAAELRQFSAEFREYRTRAFSLPFINLARVVPALDRYIMRLYRLDGAILKRTPALDAFAGIRVVSMRK